MHYSLFCLEDLRKTTKYFKSEQPVSWPSVELGTFRMRDRIPNLTLLEKRGM
jgi:hypothetical protein